MQGVYVLHYDEVIRHSKYNPDGNSTHYVGMSKDVPKRLMQHFRGKGSNFTKHAFGKGYVPIIGYVMLTDNPAYWEYQLKIDDLFEEYCAECLGELRRRRRP